MEATLNPGGDAQIKALFDEKAGYAKLLRACQARFERGDLGIDSDLRHAGIEKIAVMNEADCAKIRSMIDLDLDFLRNHLYRVGLMEKVFIDAVDRRIAAHFQSEYLPLWCRFYRNDPDGDAGISFKWHCDGGPTTHLKILLYLNASEGCGGNTQFLDRDTTDAFKRIGYVFCDTTERLDDLSGIAAEHGIPYRPQEFALQAGDALLFEPANILHRGIWPTKGPRYLLQICVVPSPVPWRTMCEAFPIPSDNHNWPAVDAHWPVRKA